MVIPVKGPNAGGPSATRERSGTTPTERTATAAASATTNAAAPSAVKLSEEGQVLSRIAGSLRDLPDVDSARVAALKDAIDKGEYKVDADRLAGRLLDADELF